MGHITILGSLTYEHIARARDFPRPGQPIRVQELSSRLGGSGGNQAVAARKQGATVSILAVVGRDTAGTEYLTHLQNLGVETEGVYTHPEVPTGMAFITKNAGGEFTSVTGAGANDRVCSETLETGRTFIARASILLASLDLPLPAVLEALTLAPMMGTQTCLCASPMLPDFPWGSHELDFVIVNESEAHHLLGRHVLHLGDGPFVLGKMTSLRIKHLIITRGADSTLAFSAELGCHEVPTWLTDVVDVEGAGDCFAGAFAAHWADHRNLASALRAASLAATVCTQRIGLQESMPERSEVDTLLKELHA